MAFPHSRAKHQGQTSSSTSSRGGDKPSTASGSTIKKRHGFRIGPKPAQGVYTGKADKIKRTLIHKAKVKKAYHKMLKREGYDVDPTSPSQGHRSKGKGKSVIDTDDALSVAGRIYENEDEDDLIDHDEEEEEGAKDEGTDNENDDDPSASDSDKGPALPPVNLYSEPEIPGDEAGEAINIKDSSHRYSRSRFGSGIASGPPSRNKGSYQPSVTIKSKQPETKIHPSRQNRFPGSSHPPATLESPEQPAKSSKPSRAEIQARREKEQNLWRERNARTGQPKLGKRVEVLLARIQRSM